MLDDVGQIQLIVESSHQDEPMGSHLQHLFATNQGCPSPISEGVPISPRGQHPIGLSQFIPQIHANNSRVILVPHGELLAILEELVLGELMSPPETVTIIIGAAPHGGTGMVVEDDHQTNVSKGLHRNIEDLQGCLADEFGIGLEVLGLHDLVVEVELEGITQPDAVHLEPVPDVHGDITQGPHLKSIHALPAEVSSRPISTCQFDSAASGIYDPHAVGGEGEGDVFHVEERLAFDELQHQFVVGCHEGLVGSHVHVTHPAQIAIICMSQSTAKEIKRVF